MDVNGNSWVEEVAHVEGENWIVKISDDPGWSIGFEANETYYDKRTTSELVSWVFEMDTANDIDAYVKPRQRALLQVAEFLKHESCIGLVRKQLLAAEESYPTH